MSQMTPLYRCTLCNEKFTDEGFLLGSVASEKIASHHVGLNMGGHVTELLYRTTDDIKLTVLTHIFHFCAPGERGIGALIGFKEV